jgi:hypothetical protein
VPCDMCLVGAGLRIVFHLQGSRSIRRDSSLDATETIHREVSRQDGPAMLPSIRDGIKPFWALRKKVLYDTCHP